MGKLSIFIDESGGFGEIKISDALGVRANLFRKGLGKIREIKNADIVGIKAAGHAFGMAPFGDITLDNHAVITSDRAINLVSVVIRK